MKSVVSDDDDEDGNPIFSYGDMVAVAGATKKFLTIWLPLQVIIVTPITAGATGGVLALLILIAIALVIFFVCKNRQRKQEADNSGSEVTFPSTDKAPSTPDTHTHSLELELVEIDNSKTDTANEDGSYLDPTTRVGDQMFLKGSDSEEDTDAPMHGIT